MPEHYILNPWNEGDRILKRPSGLSAWTHISVTDFSLFTSVCCTQASKQR
uniref:Uncharacterized protein n=1 Tax=Nelumbo nucifera TaxID=4432 RepID=A0A822Z639_NELNU|nr:TPA_asm: hypothetical protein HUJ06_013227 [Nelumbo nucifera]